MLGIEGPHDLERNARPGRKCYWPEGVVPYVIDSSLEKYRQNITEGISDYHNHTCVKFIPRTTEVDYVKIFYGDGCNSHVGRAGGEQVVSLGKGCQEFGTVVHELSHALGFYHEHSRSDRDDFITVNLTNVQKARSFFIIQDATRRAKLSSRSAGPPQKDHTWDWILMAITGFSLLIIIAVYLTVGFSIEAKYAVYLTVYLSLNVSTLIMSLFPDAVQNILDKCHTFTSPPRPQDRGLQTLGGAPLRITSIQNWSSSPELSIK